MLNMKPVVINAHQSVEVLSGHQVKTAAPAVIHKDIYTHEPQDPRAFGIVVREQESLLSENEWYEILSRAWSDRSILDNPNAMAAQEVARKSFEDYGKFLDDMDTRIQQEQKLLDQESDNFAAQDRLQSFHQIKALVRVFWDLGSLIVDQEPQNTIPVESVRP